MTGKVVSVSNRKGGVGKTTAVVSIAKTLTSQFRKSVVVLDTDPQGSASLALAGPELLEAGGPPHLEALLTEPPFDERLHHPAGFLRLQVSALSDNPDIPLALLSCSPELWEVEERISGWKMTSPLRRGRIRTRFERLIARLRDEFDYVLVDTAPGRSFLSKSILSEADAVLVPCIPDPISTWGLNIFVDELSRAQAPRGRRLETVRVIWTLFTPQQNWQAFRDQYLADHRDVRALDDGLGKYVSLADGAVSTLPTRFSALYPGEVGPRLLRVTESVIDLAGGNH